MKCKSSLILHEMLLRCLKSRKLNKKIWGLKMVSWFWSGSPLFCRYTANLLQNRVYSWLEIANLNWTNQLRVKSCICEAIIPLLVHYSPFFVLNWNCFLHKTFFFFLLLFIGLIYELYLVINSFIDSQANFRMEYDSVKNQHLIFLTNLT